jgi:hypothetical protein
LIVDLWSANPKLAPNQLVESDVEPVRHGMFRFPEAAALLRGCKTMRVRLLEPFEND